MGGLLARFGAAGLLLVVALTQISHTASSYSSPWKRGGFGMFSTVDSLGSRRLSLTVTDEAGNSYRIPLGLSELDRRRGSPTAQKFKHLWWYLDEDTIAELEEQLDPAALRRFARAILEQGYVTPLGPETAAKLKEFTAYSSGSKAGILYRGGEVLDPAQFFKLRVPLDARKRGYTPDSKLKLKSVHFQLWRKRFDTATHTLSWVPLGPAVLVLREEI